MTMVAKLKRKSGQSILEMVILVPLIVGLFFFTLNVENAISTSIVNQKYARSHLYYLFFNSRYYLEGQKWIKTERGGYLERYWIGVTDVPAGESPNALAIAPQRQVSLKAPKKTTDNQAENAVSNRQSVRIRSLAFTCIPPMGLNNVGWLTDANMREDAFEGGLTFCSSSK